MFKWIDNLLNKVTMYKIVLYVLVFQLAIAFILSLLGFLPLNPFALLFSSIFFIGICWTTNELTSIYFNAPVNTESASITALILALIISPPSTPFDGAYFGLAIWAGVWAMASKYIFTIRGKHLFNPAAFAVALTAITFNQSASWWVGTMYMLPFVLASGLLIVKKLRRFDLLISFLIVTIFSVVGSGIYRNVPLYPLVIKTLIDTPIFFFAFVMLTEPLTAPQQRIERLSFGSIVGFLIAPWVHIGSFYSTPETALLVGNIFTYIVSSKEKFLLTIKEKIVIAENTLDFVFSLDRPFDYKPGQYMEWTVAHQGPDSRGNRRYFTLASSPTEKDLRLGIKFYPKGSTFKQALMNDGPKDKIVAAQLAGDFTLPSDPNEKLVFIAGGIGVTPFRSMIKYLTDKNEKRSVTMLYSNNTVNDIAYTDVFNVAEKNVGIKTIYTLTVPTAVPENWKGETGFIDAKMIQKNVPDYAERTFFLSGPHIAVVAFEKALKELGVRQSKIKKDFFPGFA